MDRRCTWAFWKASTAMPTPMWTTSFDAVTRSSSGSVAMGRWYPAVAGIGPWEQ